MTVFKLAGFAVAAAILSLILRSYRPDIAIYIAILSGGLLLIAAMEFLGGVLEKVDATAGEYGINSEYIKTVFKAIGIGYIAQFSENICKDAGENTLAAKVELVGRLMILSLALPLVFLIFDKIKAVISV